MKKILTQVFWVAMAILAAFCLATIAISRDEHINSFWLVVASACTYIVGFRFYGKFLAAKVMALDDTRATPAERLRDGHDFEPTNKWIVFGTISPPSPDLGRWSDLPSPRSSATCREPCGSSSAVYWAGRCRIS